MDKNTVYILQKDYESPMCKVYKGVGYTAKQWLRYFPKLSEEDFDIKTDWFKPKEEPQWEILAYKDNNNGRVYGLESVWSNSIYREGFKDYTGEFSKQDCFIIHSVKRLSDGEVIEIHKTYVEDKNTKYAWVVSELTVKDNRCFANGVNILEPYLRIIKDNPKHNPLDIQNAISLLAECGYEIKAAPNTSELKSMQQAPKEEQVPIKVKVIGKYSIYKSEGRLLQFETSADFPNEKMESLKSDIEDVLNGKQEKIDNYISLKKVVKDFLDEKFPKLYTESELLQARRDAFDESRKNNPFIGFKHDNFEDYINSLK